MSGSAKHVADLCLKLHLVAVHASLGLDAEAMFATDDCLKPIDDFVDGRFHLIRQDRTQEFADALDDVQQSLCNTRGAVEQPESELPLRREHDAGLGRFEVQARRDLHLAKVTHDAAKDAAAEEDVDNLAQGHLHLEVVRNLGQPFGLSRVALELVPDRRLPRKM